MQESKYGLPKHTVVIGCTYKDGTAEALQWTYSDARNAYLDGLMADPDCTSVWWRNKKGDNTSRVYLKGESVKAEASERPEPVANRWITVKAKNVKEGDFLDGVGSAYVYASTRLTEGRQYICFHTNDGEEGYLSLSRDQSVTVKRSK